MTQDDYNDAILTCTGHPEWEVIKQGLANDIYASQALALDATNWDQVVELKGFARGLAFFMNLRETTLQAKAQGSAMLGDDDAFL